jgi:uncharacterized protein YjiS (DUF1127 family)
MSTRSLRKSVTTWKKYYRTISNIEKMQKKQ